MRVLTSVIVLFISCLAWAQADTLGQSITISKEEAIHKSKGRLRSGYSLQYAELYSNHWRIVYTKYVGQTADCITVSSGVCAVYKNLVTIIEARTGKVMKKSKRISTLARGGNIPSQVSFMKIGKRKRKMKVGNRKITVYY